MRPTEVIVAVSVAAFAVVTTAACSVTPVGGQAAGYDKQGYATKVEDGRLWVFPAGSKDYADFAKGVEPKVIVTRIGAGPNGMTIRSNDPKVIDGYLAAK